MHSNTSNRLRNQPEHDPNISAALACPTERELVAAARGGDDTAFEELVHRSRAKCLRVICCMIPDSDDALDELQNTYLSAYKSLCSFNGEAKFSTWIIRIAINRCLARYRERKGVRFLPYFLTDDDGKCYTPYQSADDSPEQSLGRTQTIEVLTQELRRVPHLLRLPLELRFIRELPIGEIAGILGISEAAAKSRLHRARSVLRARMRRHCGHRGVGTLTRKG